MVQVFICVVVDCPNENVRYELTDAKHITVCGGCKAVLIGVPVNE
jgi:hypothetical protein